MLDERSAAKEVAQLHDDEQQEERVEQSEGDGERGDARGHEVHPGCGNRTGEKRPAQQAGRQGAPEANEKRMLDDAGCIEGKEIPQHVREYLVRLCKQRREDREQRRRDEHAGEDTPHMAQPPLARQLAPIDVAPQQDESAGDAGDGRRRTRPHVVDHAPAHDTLALDTGRGERQRPNEREHIELRELGGVAPHERRPQQQGRDSEPRRVGSRRDPVTPDQPDSGGHQTHRPNRHVQAPGHRAEQRVADHSTGDPGRDDFETQPGAGRDGR